MSNFLKLKLYEIKIIPFIIGGVALAATGYGVAKLLEDDCNCEKNQCKKYLIQIRIKKRMLQTISFTSIPMKRCVLKNKPI